MKQEKIVSDTSLSSSQSTYYARNYIYKKGLAQLPVTLTFFNSEEGYIEPVFKSVGVISDFEYTYQYKDHLGNIRLSYQDMDKDGSINAETEIKEENHYYPFGLKHKGYNNQITGRDHQYGFNGKEEQNELSLNWSDYGARNFDASLGRWMSLDPLADNYYFDSPYVYTTNNPILYIDPDGRYWERTVGENGTVTYTAGEGDSAWSLYEQHGKKDGFSAAQADAMVQNQLRRPNYIRESDGMLMSNVEIGDMLTINNNPVKTTTDNTFPDTVDPVDAELIGLVERLPKGGGVFFYGFGMGDGESTRSSESASSSGEWGGAGLNPFLKLALKFGEKNWKQQIKDNEVPNISSRYLDSDKYSMDTIFKPIWETNSGNLFTEVRNSRGLDSVMNRMDSIITSDNLKVRSFRVDTVNKRDVNIIHKKIKSFGGQN